MCPANHWRKNANPSLRVVTRFAAERQINVVNQKSMKGDAFPLRIAPLPPLSIDAHEIPCYPIFARSVSKWGRLAALLTGHGGICAASPTAL